MKRYCKIIFCIFLSSSIFASNGSSDVLETSILQYKTDRLYFPCGTEADIYEGCQFSIAKNGDEIFKDIIDVSLPGISISQPVNHFFDSLSVENFEAFIKPAEIDTLRPIRIGIPSSIMYGENNDRNLLFRYDSLTYVGNELTIKTYDSELEMQIEFESGKLDGFFSFGIQETALKSGESILSPAPFVAALIPNLSSDLSARGILTTSLFYRFDENKLSILFNGKNPIPIYCLLITDDSCARPYEYSPEKGRNLLNYFKSRPEQIRLAMTGRSLQRLGEYFADILSRDGVRVKPVEKPGEADICLRYLPYIENQPDSSLIYIINSLSHDTLPGNEINEALIDLANFMELYSNTSNTSSKNHYIKLAQRTLNEDIGLFLLFRPLIQFTARNRLKGYQLDQHGLFDIKSLKIIKLPDDSLNR